MTAEDERRGALEAIGAILERGGDADDVLRAVLEALSRLYAHVSIAFVEDGGLVEGPAAGALDDQAEPVAYAIEFQGAKVAELHVVAPGADDDAFLRRVAADVAPYALVGWDTGGETWEP